jgi:hypothetical protein
VLVDLTGNATAAEADAGAAPADDSGDESGGSDDGSVSECVDDDCLAPGGDDGAAPDPVSGPGGDELPVEPADVRVDSSVVSVLPT